jgi:hypothetical protein
MTVDKFDPNPILVKINKLKPYRFMEDQTFQPILVKPNDFLPKELVEMTHFDNMSTKQQVEETHFDNLSNGKPFEITHHGNLFIEELI